MSLATVASVVSIAGGVRALTRGSSSSGGGGQQAAQAADPFGELRKGFGNRLQFGFDELTRFDPTQISLDPAYQFRLRSGIDAVNRGAAANGMLGSGNRLIALQELGQGLATDFTQQQWQRNMGILGMLGQFSGATTGSPASAGNLMFQGQQAGNQQFNSGLNSITSGLGGLSRTNWGNLFGGNNGGGAPGAGLWNDYYGSTGP